MGWFGSKKSGRFEVVANTGIRVQENYTYYLGLDGNVWRTDENNGPELVSVSGVSPADGFLYFIQEESGNIARMPKPRDFYDLPSVLADFS